nr:MAG TPA: hypothetical protein [Bacteriophage sp.]
MSITKYPSSMLKETSKFKSLTAYWISSAIYSLNSCFICSISAAVQ